MQHIEKSTNTTSNDFCVFEYIYRDASNYKSWGEILLSGTPSQNNIELLLASLESGEYFVAEQVGIPTLYQALWALSDGPNDDDHALHEFATLRAANEDDKKSLILFGDLSNLIITFQSVTKWDYSLSPNFNID